MGNITRGVLLATPSKRDGGCYTRGIVADTCKHPRKRLIAKDKDAEYVECLDCGAILETEELGSESTAGFNESLSDA